jgi:hypothetical protein
MKKLLLVPALLAGCATKNEPPSYVYANPPPVQIILDAKVQQMSRQDVINAVHDCESNGLRAAPIMSKRMVSGMMSDIVIDVHCMPRPKYPYSN